MREQTSTSAELEMIAQLRATLGKLELALGSISEAIVWTDGEGRIQWCNAAFDRLVGARHLEILGSAFTARVPLSEEGHPVAADAHPASLVLGPEPMLIGCYQYSRRDREVVLEITGCRVRTQEHESSSVFALHDITERVRAEMALKALNETLERRVAQRTASVEERSRELARMNAELERMTSVAAHDLQEPLRKVQAFGDRLKAQCGDSLNEGARDSIQRMQSATARMQSLIGDLLTYSRVTTKAAPFVGVDLAAVVKEVVSDLDARIRETRARVDVGELPTIEADPVQMWELFQNLIGNALKFHRPDSPPLVTVRGGVLTGTSPSLCRVTIADNGIGFDEKYLHRIFTVFQRLHGRDEFEGTGIGLAICRKIATHHGGDITAMSRPGEGATFVVTLPVAHGKREQAHD